MVTRCPKCGFENQDGAVFCAKCATRLGSEAKISVTRTIETTPEGSGKGEIFAGRFELIEKLGAGGMGIVYRTYDKEVGEEIALKVLHPDVALDEKTVDRFRNEIKLARRITHKNVCRMHELHQDGKQLFITMEYVPGQDLKELIKEGGAMPAGRAISVAKQVAEGLAEAHDLGVIHRDLKPQNIMVDKEGNAKIMDFGIARSLRAQGMTAEGMIIGTPEYMAPEQVEGLEADQRTDIYALGAIIFEMVTGRVPFEGDSPLSVAYKHKNEPPIPPRKLNTQVPEPLNGLVLRCLEKEKESRYQNADEVLADLVRIEEGLPISERVILKARPAIRIAREKPGLKRFLIPALAGLGIITVLVLWRVLAPGKGTSAYPPVTENSIAVISFENQTGDPAYDRFGKMIPNLLITGLEGTRFFNDVVTWERMQDLLKQTGKKDLAFIDPESGFEACRRGGIKSLIVGSLAKAGSTFMIDVKVQDAATRRLVKSASSRGTGEDSILLAQIDELTRKIAEGMGISQQQAESYSTKIADATTGSPEAYSFFLRGRDELDRLLYDDARRSLERAVALDPAFAIAYLYLARTYAGLMDPKASNEAMVKAKQYSGKAAEKDRLYIEAAYTSQIEKDQDKRLKILRELTDRYPSEKYAQYDLARYYGSRGLSREAVSTNEKVLALDPSFGPALNSLGLIYSDEGDFVRALQYLERYAALSPSDPNPRDSIAELYVRMGRIEQAVEKYRDVLAGSPDFYVSWAGLAHVSALQENYAEVDRCLAGFLAHAPTLSTRIEGQWLTAFYDYLRGRWDRALAGVLEIYDQVAKAGRAENARPALWLASFIYRDKGENQLALRYSGDLVESSTKLDPASGTFWKATRSFFQGWVDVERGRPQDAEAALREMESLLPGITDAGHKGQALFLHALLAPEVALAGGDVERAVALGQKIPGREYGGAGTVAMANYNMPFLKDVLARAYWKRGDLGKAAAEYRKLMTIDPANQVRYLIHPLYHYRLGRVLEEKGDKKQARAEYQKFLEYWKDADATHPELADARKRLAALGS